MGSQNMSEIGKARISAEKMSTGKREQEMIWNQGAVTNIENSGK